ncbi:MAG: TIGR03560 family F420-dependent LLM class oxidoreductase [Dehalococcoidia bacterium]
MDLGVMIEGQEGLDWPLWRRIVTETERLGFESLWRSDHFMSLSGPRNRPALETFVSLVMAAELSSRIRFGTLVASMTFRHPSLLARMAAQVDDLSGGRFILGVGAGWNVPEHEAFGLPFPPLKERMDRLDEGIRVLKTLWGDGPGTFEGQHYTVRDAEVVPKPAQRPMPLLVGGRGEKRTLRIVAEHASEWNITAADLDTYRFKAQVLEQHCMDVERDPSTIRHSQMCGFVIGRDDAGVRAHLGRLAERMASMQGDADEVLERLRGNGWLIGTTGEVVEEIGRREEAGLSRIMMQHHVNTDFDLLELIASDVLPQVQR